MKELLYTAAFPYLLKQVLVSGLLFGYYRLFLRDRVFHQYNRFYLLGASLASIILPMVRLPLPAVLPLIGQTPVWTAARHAILPGDWNEAGSLVGQGRPIHTWPDAATLVAAVYVLVFFITLVIFLRQLLHIRQLPKRFPVEKLGPVDLYMTREPGTPFSFLNRLFWNAEIDIDSQRGRQIFLHEWFHIRQRHTLDLLWLRATLVCFWVNPFFYLIYREIRTIHEYLADRYAVAGGDCYEYAELLVWHHISDRPISMLHPFFQSSIKRRITMLTRFNPRRPGLGSRVMVLPLTFLLLTAFAVRKGPVKADLPPLKVVIDAGHGGSDNGTVWGDAREKDINLALALKVKQLAAAYHLDVVLTRETDELAGGKSDIRASLEYRAEMAKASRGDLFVSLHVNNAAGGKPEHGFLAFVSADNAHYSQSIQLASALIDAVKTNYDADENLRRRTEHIYVLRETAMPAVLLECGSIDNPRDLAFIRDSRNQEKIARDILQGIQHYQEAQAADRR